MLSGNKKRGWVADYCDSPSPTFSINPYAKNNLNSIFESKPLWHYL